MLTKAQTAAKNLQQNATASVTKMLNDTEKNILKKSPLCRKEIRGALRGKRASSAAALFQQVSP